MENLFEVKLERTTETNYISEEREPITALQVYIVEAKHISEAYKKAEKSHSKQFDKGIWDSQITKLENFADSDFWNDSDTILLGSAFTM